MKKKVNIIKSETWLKMDLSAQNECLNECISDFVEDNERIINIQLVEGSNGLSYFLIYTITE